MSLASWTPGWSIMEMVSSDSPGLPGTTLLLSPFTSFSLLPRGLWSIRIRTESTPTGTSSTMWDSQVAGDERREQRDMATSQEHHRLPATRRLQETSADKGPGTQDHKWVKTTGT